MKRSTRIKRAAIAVALVLAAPAAYAGLQGNGLGGTNGINSTNGLGTVNGFTTNGLAGTNGINSTNGLGSVNGFSGNGLGSSNGINSTNGLGGMNGFSGNGLGGSNGFALGNELARKAVADQAAHKTACEGIDRHVFCHSANPFTGLSIQPLGAPAHDPAAK